MTLQQQPALMSSAMRAEAGALLLLCVQLLCVLLLLCCKQCARSATHLCCL